MPRSSVRSSKRNWSAATSPLGLYPNSPTPRLYDRVRAELRAGKLNPETEQAYVESIKRYLHFHKHQHPTSLNQKSVAAFLRSLTDERLSSSEREQILAAVLFLYRDVLPGSFPWLRSLFVAALWL